MVLGHGVYRYHCQRYCDIRRCRLMGRPSEVITYVLLARWNPDNLANEVSRPPWSFVLLKSAIGIEIG